LEEVKKKKRVRDERWLPNMLQDFSLLISILSVYLNSNMN